MNFIITVLKTIFAVYCLLIFSIGLIIVIPLDFLIFNLLPENKSPQFAHAVSRACGKYMLLFFLVRVRIENKKLIDRNSTYVFVANHLSLLDIPVYAISCRNTFRFLAKEELTKIPMMGYLIKKLYVTVKRSDKQDRQKSLEKMLISLQNGISVFICPEGTRNKTNEPLLAFKDGAFRLAIASQLPIAVLTIVNSNRLLSPDHLIQMRPGKIFARWSEPIKTIGMTDEDIPRLKKLVAEQMLLFMQEKLH